MSLVILANLCSHLTNASKARLGLTSVPSTNMNLRLTLALQKAGFLSTVVRAGPTPPPAHSLLNHPHAESEAEQAVTRQNIASRRLWLGLKYWDSDPVLEKMEVVSKPTRRIHMDVSGLSMLVRGQQNGMVPGLRKPGECLFVATDRGVLEARECVERRIGGILLCRAH